MRNLIHFRAKGEDLAKGRAKLGMKASIMTYYSTILEINRRKGKNFKYVVIWLYV